MKRISKGSRPCSIIGALRREEKCREGLVERVINECMKSKSMVLQTGICTRCAKVVPQLGIMYLLLDRAFRGV